MYIQMLVCPKCRTPNPDSMKFCHQCACQLAAQRETLCPACGQSVPQDSRYCGQCGEKLFQEQHCGQCGMLLDAGNRFCGHCGASASVQGTNGAQARAHHRNGNGKTGQNGKTGNGRSNGVYNGARAAARPAGATSALMDNLRSLMPHASPEQVDDAATQISGEQREVTVLFLDVTNFTAASHRMDSEDIFLIIDEAMRLLVEIVYKYEGTVDKFTGDGLIALFGAPFAHENDPERALRASLEMLQVLQPLRARTMAQHHFDFQVRIGVNTGLAIAGSLGNDLHMEYTVIGDTVNLASRLETAAQPGSVLVSFSTYQRTRPLFNFVALPALHIKGFPEPVRAYRPLQVREQPGSVRGLPGMQVQMIGRARELARLRAAMQAVSQTGKRQITLVTGDAGLGKSRLVAEFCARLKAQNIPYYQGNCLAYARSRPLWVLAELIRDMVGITEVDPLDIQKERLQNFLDRIDIEDSKALQKLMRLLEVTSPNPDHEIVLTEQVQQGITELVQEILLNVQPQPYVLIFDDLHWVDRDSLSFLLKLIAVSKNAPLHLVLVSRDFERLTVIRPLLEQCLSCSDSFQDIRLRALNADESRQLVSQLVWHTSSELEELSDVIIDRAEGNPFYTEEIVRMLIDRGGIVDQEDGWMITNRAQDLLRSIPGTLRGLILARFDQLNPGLRNTLQRAAVLGRSFPTRLLEKMHEGNRELLDSHLAELCNRQFLAEATVFSEGGFAFRHTLIQEAVYSTLLKRDRRRLHGLVAEVIQDASFWLPEEQAQVLAYHYAESDAPDRAIPYTNGNGSRLSEPYSI